MDTNVETRFIQLSDERQISYCEYGDPEGSPVFYFHGTPGSRFEPHFGDQAGKDHGYRILAPDRPGIGRSDYMKARKLLDWPQDISQIAGQLGLDKFGVIGVSGGSAFALACSYAIPEKLQFTVLMGTWAPVAEEPSLWKQMAPLDQFFGKLSGSFPWAFYGPFSMIGYAAKWLPPQGFAKSLESSMCAADKTLLQDHEIARFFANDIKEAFRQGVRGPADDAILLYRDWGFKIKEIPGMVELFHGEDDRFAPYNYAVYLDEQIPNSDLHSFPGQGHLFLMNLFGQVFTQVSRS